MEWNGAARPVLSLFCENLFFVDDKNKGVIGCFEINTCKRVPLQTNNIHVYQSNSKPITIH